MRIARILLTAAASAVLLTTSAAAVSAAPREAGVHHYVALGDSYTSGPLIPAQRWDPLGCGRSTNNYPSFVARALHPDRFTDVSCGGAKTTHMVTPQAVQFGGVNPPQFSALRASTDLVTLGIGGNDSDVFGTLVGTCPGLRATDPHGNPCQRRYTSGGTDTMKAAVARTGQDVVTVLKGIHQRSPHAKVLVVGYPRIAPPKGYCPAVLPFADGDYGWLDSVEQALNAALAKAVAADGKAVYVDTYGPSLGHDACARGGAAWINGQYTQLFAALSYHPFRSGMLGVANVVLEHLT
ncbi:SGNH/GDSL hydrolase family protein [Amycolatopsis sp. NPDC059021]|uniref:SGNH/GDSL hydrolase family protein n=1 Tax=Amycolatopsis sp. NPDC059021 TaxID=3346704 RepID=UPI00367132E0